jgi:cytochrome P450
MMEATLLLATIARRYKLSAVSDQPIVPFPTITLRPSGGVIMRLTRRPHVFDSVTAPQQESMS